MSETTEVHKCPVCEGQKYVTIPMKSEVGIATMQCKSCNGTGIITTDIVTPFSGGSEQFPDKEIFRMGTEQFNEIFEAQIAEYGLNCISCGHTEWLSFIRLDDKIQSLSELFQQYIGNIYGEDVKVKISCKTGKVIIERSEKE
jgi:predicted nucleic-acid-binding Zn-ribbon protein